MRELDKIAEKLFDKIRTRFENVNLGDEKSKRTSEQEQARFFNFDYVSRSGKNYGNVTISIMDGDGLKVFFSKNITDELEHEEQDEWFNFLRSIRNFAKKNFLSFDARDINKSNLDLRDIKQQSKADAKFSSTDVSGTSAVAESKLYGNRNTSFQECGPVRIRIKHSTTVDEERRGARSRNIEAIYLDNHLGERHLLPFTNLRGARAMATHCSHGGHVDDDLGVHIGGLVTEMGAMRNFVRQTKHRQFEDTETSKMAKAAAHRYGELQHHLHRLSGHKGYSQYREDFDPCPESDDDMDIESLRDRFAKKTYDKKVDNALPYVYRAYQKQQESTITAMGEDFEAWASSITESTFETDDDQVNALKDIMSKPLLVGDDAIDATNVLRPVFDDIGLEDQLSALADEQGTDTDARQTVLDWMRGQGMAYLADDIEEDMANEGESQNNEEPPAEEPPAEPQAPTESIDPLNRLRRLAGMHP